MLIFIFLTLLLLLSDVRAFSPHYVTTIASKCKGDQLSHSSASLPRIIYHSHLNARNGNENLNNDGEEEAKRLREQAEKLRNQIREMEKQIQNSPSSTRSNNNSEYIKPRTNEESATGKTKSKLSGKNILIVGSNGRLGSMVTRYILRTFPEVNEVIATIHVKSDYSTLGYGRLSYEVGAEDGIGFLNSAWTSEEDGGNNARFEYADYMKDYNLNKLRVVEVELLDPLQCQTITENADIVIYCATDFNGNTPRSISSPFNPALLFRAVASPTKGRVEIEGLENILGGLKLSKTNQKRMDAINNASSGKGDNDNEAPSVILVSTAPTSFPDYETPFGEFNGLKRQAENILQNNFPSLSHVILQMCKYEDNFVSEDLDINFDVSKHSSELNSEEENDPSYPSYMDKVRRKINRRDAARAVGDSLLNESLKGKIVEVWTAIR